MYWKTGFKSKFKKHFETTREFLFFLSRRAQNDTIFRVAASLSYTSLIAVVPLFAIGLAIFSAFPVFDGVKEQVKEFLLRNFVPTIEQEVSQYFAEFIDAAAQLTTIGVVGIAITAILMLSTIENSLNFIFKVTRPRRLTTKITLTGQSLPSVPCSSAPLFRSAATCSHCRSSCPKTWPTPSCCSANSCPR